MSNNEDILPKKLSDDSFNLAMYILEQAMKAPKPWDPEYAEYRLDRMDPRIINLFAGPDNKTLGKITIEDFYSKSGLKEKYGATSYPIFNSDKHLTIKDNIVFLGNYTFTVKIIPTDTKNVTIVEFTPMEYSKFDSIYTQVLNNVVDNKYTN